MKNFKRAHYSTLGSSALESECVGNIIEFPAPFEREEGSAREEGPLARAARRAFSGLLKTQSAQDLMYGSFKGKAFGRAKRWQSVAMGASLFLIACAFVLFGNPTFP
ncbi:MAG: hypothetical protein FWG23_01830 [Eggerthellaceae bacterium]|jgi:hypothetical protein|nr:hypothetical protein [Eggerthellaceae bacterium]MDR2715692.1 hypothetical protein [Coriobacteriaceae bacterium]